MIKTILCLSLILFPMTIHNKEIVSAVKPSKNEVKCLAATMYMEARGEKQKGMYLVASVVINRMKYFKQSVCEVVVAKHQFSWYKGHIKNVPVKYIKEAEKILTLHLNGYWKDIAHGAMFYAHKDIQNYWTEKFKIVLKYRNHIFYKEQ